MVDEPLQIHIHHEKVGMLRSTQEGVIGFLNVAIVDKPTCGAHILAESVDDQ